MKWLLIEKIIKILAGILITGAVARELGPENYGILAFSIGVVSVFAAFASMGSDHYNLSELSRRKDLAKTQFYKTAFITRLIWILITGILYFIYVINLENNFKLYAILSLLIISSGLSILTDLIHSEDDFSKISKLIVTSIIIGSMIKLYGVYKDLNLYYFAVVNVIEVITPIIYLFIVYFKKNRGLILIIKKRRKEIVMYISKCLPLAFTSILVALYFRIELFIINYYLGNEKSGLWAALILFITPWIILITSITPKINMNLAKIDFSSKLYKEKIKYYLLNMFIVGIFIAIFNSIAAYTFVPIIFGEKYNEIRYLITIASLSIPFILIGSIQEIWNANNGKNYISIIKMLITLPISVLMLMFFLPMIGLLGAVVSMVFSIILTNFLLNFIVDCNYGMMQINALIQKK